MTAPDPRTRSTDPTLPSAPRVFDSAEGEVTRLTRAEVAAGTRQFVARRRFTRTCFNCGGTAAVLAPEGSDDLDVEAEFSSAGRQFASDPDGSDPIGVACYRCARRLWERLP